MLPSTSSATLSTHSMPSPQSSSPVNTSSVARVDLIKNKLSSITPDQTSYEINCFKAFFDSNEGKILALSNTGDSFNGLLKTVATTINTIRDNIETGEDNAENYVQLNQLKDEIDKLTQSGESKNTGIGDRIGKEIDRVAPRVENEVKRSADKIAKEAKRFFRKF